MTDITSFSKVVSVGPALIEVEVNSTEDYRKLDETLQIGSYVQISDDDGSNLITVVQSFRIKDSLGADNGEEVTEPRFILSLQPVGTLEDGVFSRGGKQITIPPRRVTIASSEILKTIYASARGSERFTFSSLAQNKDIPVVLDGDRFFGKHIGLVGSTGSGKSSAVAAIIQRAREPEKDQKLNNSHIVLFDLHGEYAPAFPGARVIGAEQIRLPYWLMNADELEEMFIESHEANSHNQVSQFRNAVIENKRLHNQHMASERVSYDSPVYFSLTEVIDYLWNLNREVIGGLPGEGKPKRATGEIVEDRIPVYFNERVDFVQQSTARETKASNGPFNGEFNRFLMRLEARINDSRLGFLLAPRKADGAEYMTDDLERIVEQFVGYGEEPKNVTIIDLSGVPFEVLSIVVALVTRICFSLSFAFKRIHGNDEKELPLLLVYEEAHNYVPRKEAARYSSATTAIERVAKEGRKYGLSLMIVSQRPSEISETVFSQCNNFVVMRLTNPTDQQYVRRLLPDSMASMTDSLATLEQREAVLVGDAVVIPSLVTIQEITDKPASVDIKFKTEWVKDWLADGLEGIAKQLQS